MITLRNIERYFEYGPEKNYVLRGVNLDIEEREFVTIMGPSGAGKSTLLHAIGMHDTSWTGEYYFFDQAVHKLKPKERAELRNKNIGFVFQSYHLLDQLTVYENLEVPLSYRDIKKSQRDSIINETLARFQLTDKKNLYPSRLSGGLQQLIGVARAVIANPKVILADEPTGNLHSAQAREIMELFTKLNQQGTTIIQVTHSETNAAYSHRIIQLADGLVVKETAE
ncbi:MAG TPA: ABC transporter ATP-binding protein [Blastocatellia bacterium]|nr:ABC transporter ATP-binding protein [Blastocatellia bacterium]